MLKETFTLNNGVKIPKLGLGTWFIEGDKAADAVREAVKSGYRLIDTAPGIWKRAWRRRRCAYLWSAKRGNLCDI